MVKNIVDYDFECLSSSEFKLSFDVGDIKNRMMNLIFSKSKDKLKKKNIDIKDASFDDIDEFDVNEHYLKLLGVIINRMIKDVFGQVSRDGIKVLRHDVKKAKFVRDLNRDWIVKILIFGDYIKK